MTTWLFHRGPLSRLGSVRSLLLFSYLSVCVSIVCVFTALGGKTALPGEDLFAQCVKAVRHAVRFDAHECIALELRICGLCEPQICLSQIGEFAFRNTFTA